MQFVRNSLFVRSTTIFGVCEALGQDFKVSPNWFRVAFAAAVIFNLEYALLAYALAAAVVLVSRFVYPNPVKTAEAAPAAAQTVEPVAVVKAVENTLAQAA